MISEASREGFGYHADGRIPLRSQEQMTFDLLIPAERESVPINWSQRSCHIVLAMFVEKCGVVMPRYFVLSVQRNLGRDE